MKKVFAVLLVSLSIGLLAACGGETYELALITDHGPVDDRSFNQGAWEGVEAYAEEHDITYRYFRPAEDSGAARLDAIELAVDAGAKLIVTPGFAFSEAVHRAQEQYPDVKFVLLDAEPARDGETHVGDNTLSIYYAEEQAGFLVGYAAVKEGHHDIGFFGGVSVPAVIRFGVGYIEGAEYAAREDDVDVTVRYRYLGTFDAVPQNRVLASSWYEDGADLIFVAAGGAINNAVTAAEEQDGKWVIGANVNQMDVSDVILTSSLKELKNSVYMAIEEFYNDEFRGGEAITLTAGEEGVGIPDDFSRFENFTEEMYNDIFNMLVTGEIEVTSAFDLELPDDLDLERTTVIIDD